MKAVGRNSFVPTSSLFRRGDGFRPRFRVLISSLVLLVVTASCNTEARGPGQVPAPLDDRPNILIFFTDDQSLKSFRQMPFLQRRPGGHWLNFKNGYISTPLCCPSRATMLTGQYSFRSGVIGNDGRPFDDSSSIATWLNDAGYRTGLVGKYMNHVADARGDTYIPPGWDHWVTLLTYSYFDYRLNENGEVTSRGSAPEDYLTDVINEKALEFLKQESDEPFFLWMSYRAPHKPTIPAPRHEGLLKDLDPRLGPSFNKVAGKPKWMQSLEKQRRAKMKEEYRQEARSMLSVDESIRDVVRLLRSQGELDNTVLFFLTDNGFSRGQHRWRNKSCVYDECVRTPFMVRYPGAPEGGKTFGHLVANDDIAPTIVELAEAEAGLESDGLSLVPFLDGTAPDKWRSSLLLTLRLRSIKVPPYWAIRTKRWKYVKLSTGERELYDLRNDPHEIENLAGRRGLRATQRRLAERLERLKQ